MMIMMMKAVLMCSQTAYAYHAAAGLARLTGTPLIIEKVGD